MSTVVLIASVTLRLKDTLILDHFLGFVEGQMTENSPPLAGVPEVCKVKSLVRRILQTRKTDLEEWGDPVRTGRGPL
jgi:hypothetical protein